MDVIALGKATKVLKQAKDLDENIIAAEAESHFQTVDARLDWLEGQAGKLQITKTIDVNLENGTFNNTELNNGAIKLKKIKEVQGISSYVFSGSYESPVVDLGEFWYETTLMDIKKQIAENDTLIDIYIASSSDGKTFTPYQVFNPNRLQQSQFIKFKFELSATPIPGEVNTYSFNQSNDNKVTLNEFVTINGSLQLTQDYSYVTEDVAEVEGGKVVKATIPRQLFTKMKSVEVK
ncbi:hypothetical protein ACWA2C_17040 [Priestia megaterium]